MQIYEYLIDKIHMLTLKLIYNDINIFWTVKLIMFIPMFFQNKSKYSKYSRNSKNISKNIKLKSYINYTDTENVIICNLSKLINTTKKELKNKNYFYFSLLNYNYYNSTTNKSKRKKLDFILEEFEYLKYEFDQFKNIILVKQNFNIWLKKNFENSIDTSNNIYNQNIWLKQVLLNDSIDVSEKKNKHTHKITYLQLNILQLHIEFINKCLNFEISEAEILFKQLYKYRSEYLDYLTDIKPEITFECQLTSYLNKDYNYNISYKQMKLGELHLLSCDNCLELYKNDTTFLNKTIQFKQSFDKIKEQIQTKLT